MLDLFADAEPWQEPLAPGAVILRRFALSRASALLAGIHDVAAVSPFRHMVTPGGYTMSVAMTNCGTAGWATNERGYLYAPDDPITGKPWPPMPAVFQALCHDAAVVWRCDLCTVLPVYFVTIVFRRIMACSHIDSGCTSQVTDCIRQLRSRTKALENVCFDTVRCQT